MAKKEYPKIKSVKSSKFKCATTGRHSCDECGTPIERGDTLRIVDVKFVDGSKERFTFDSKKCRESFRDKNGFKS